MGRPSPFLQDVAATAVTSVLATLAVIVATRLLAQGLGTDGFGAYSLARRFVATVAPFSTIMMGDAVVRYLATVPRDARHPYVLGGIALGVGPSLALAAVAIPLRAPLSRAIYHGSGFESVVLASLGLLVAYAVYSVLYAVYRGSGRMGHANLWALAVTGVAPVVVAWQYGSSGRVDVVLWAIAAASGVAAVPLSAYAAVAFRVLRHAGAGFAVALRSLFRYGAPRMPGALAFAGLLTIGPGLAPYVGTLRDAGYLVVGQSLLRVMEGVVVAFDLVTLPKVAQLLTEDRYSFLRQRVTDILALVLHIGLFATLHLWLWCDLIVRIWLGAEYAPAIPLMRVTLLGLVPYLAHLMLRAVLDAADTRAVNARNLYLTFPAALLACAALAGLGLGAMGLAIGTVVGFAGLGALTVRSVARRFPLDSGALILLRALFLNAALFLGAAIVRTLVARSGLPDSGLVVVALTTEVAAFAAYLAVLSKWNVRWLAELRHRMA